jgi:hypothetical protein
VKLKFLKIKTSFLIQKEKNNSKPGLFNKHEKEIRQPTGIAQISESQIFFIEITKFKKLKKALIIHWLVKFYYFYLKERL